MSRKAFTLIELLIVIAIIAILALIAVPNFLEAQTRAKVSRAKADMRSVATAIEAYFVDYNFYPINDLLSRKPLVGTSDPIFGIDDDPYSAYLYSGWLMMLRNGQGLVNPVIGLTTPIAYITTFPVDPFGKTIASNYTTIGGARDTSYFYNNIFGARFCHRSDPARWQAENGYLLPNIDAPAVFNGPDGKTYQIDWMLESPGPDQVVDIQPAIRDENQWERLTGQGTTYVIIYDPTNGTTSGGDLFRLSSGVPGGE